MNSKSTKEWITIASNLGVVIGLVVLIVEINQNSRIASATAQLELAQDRREAFQYATTELDIDTKYRFGEEVTDRELTIAIRIYDARIRTYETQWHFWRNGLIDDEQFEGYQLLLDGTISTPRIVDFWNDRKSSFHPEFAQLVDERLARTE